MLTDEVWIILVEASWHHLQQAYLDYQVGIRQSYNVQGGTVSVAIRSHNRPNR